VGKSTSLVSRSHPLETKRTTTCKCGGGYKTSGHYWVVIERNGTKGKSHLKCLLCNWKWKSTCKYVSLLRDHKERSRKGMTNELILERLLNGTLSIDPETSTVYSHSKKWKNNPKELTQVENNHKSGYLFVSICKGGLKKKIGVHVLQMMAYTKTLIPVGYDVHHKTAPPRPQLKDNSLANLALRLSSLNQSRREDTESF
jgi:hypothetical protein